ncbi:Transcription initiation factor IIB [Gigaspora margarita]|uniref:Transcription initiation factor IIB n=1 Tax=Gigaspora margarita TaxID=4874 RepID=A0A8H4ALM6_GIGMA|nr:Transcription initiation factor IIB [Gigaspora margarita]
MSVPTGNVFPKLKRTMSEEESLTSSVILPDLNIRLICPICKNPQPKIIEEYANGDLVCGECGLVLCDHIIDTRSEWRTFQNDYNEKDASRVGAPADPFLPGAALETTISSKGKSDLTKTHFKATVDKNTLTLKHALHEIEAMCTLMDLSKEVIDTTKQLYKRTVEEKVIRGKNKITFYAACIYVACRISKVARSFKEICASTQVSKKLLAHAVKNLVATFELNMGLMTSEDLMTRFCNRLGLTPDIERICSKISQRIEELGLLTGRTQNTIAAATIHFITNTLNIPISIEKIALVSGMAVHSIKSVSRIIYSEQKKLSDLLGD